MLQELISFQREIYLAFANQITAFANGGGWSAFLVYLPMGILFGAAHAMTPGHSKAVLATYLVGSPSGFVRGLSVSLALSFTHVTISVLIAILALPLVSITLGSLGRAPMLEDVSRGFLGLIGLWMLYRAFRHKPHGHDQSEGVAFGFMAGLIPCPLTLFVMSFAITRGVPQAGVAFALTMMIGVALVLSLVALTTILCRQRVVYLIEGRPILLDRITRGIEVVAGLTLTAIAVRELTLR